jgi:hypothetical protein
VSDSGSSGSVFRATCSFQIETCIYCGCKFGLDLDYLACLKNGQGGVRSWEKEQGDDEEAGKTYATFTCPNGHEQGYIERREDILAESAVKATRRAEFAEAKAERLETTVDKLKAERDRLKRKLKRVDESAPHPEAAPRATRLAGATCGRSSRRRD